MNRLFHVIFLCCFGTLLISPSVQICFEVFPPAKLSGVEKKAILPKFTVSSWFNGSFQNRFEAWYDQTYGLRDYFVRTDNQINFSLFHQVSTQQNLNLVLSKDNNLFERPYIDSFLSLDSKPEKNIQAIAEQIQKLQNCLAFYGIPFLFMISPSKATIYPEFIPDYMIARKRNNTLSNYEKLLPFLEKYRINYLDGQKFISDLKKQCDYPLFPKGGTHWNYFASYKITLQLMRSIEMLTGKSLHRLKLEKIVWDSIPRYSDDDLAQLANLWDPNPFFTKNPYPVVHKETVKGAVLPNVLLEGASFAVAPYWYMTTNNLISDLSNRHVYYRVKSIEDIDKEIFSRDIVILESTVLELPYLNRGFMPLVLSELEKIWPPLP